MALDHVLKGCELFFELYEDEVERILRSQSVHHYKPNELIIQEGDKGNQIFILLEGIAEIQKNAMGGTKFNVEKLKPGEVFGLLMILDEKPYGIDIISRTRCAVLEVKHAAIMDLFDKNPRIFGIIMLNICRIIGKRLRNAHQRMSEYKGE
ncbi:Crp/Fnr family transcriptional regulator [Pseudobacteriovorax antillogorgiicola]|uniref:Cyclic nucleotide-binding domain-containing protein n=1 Tax=Pseudobacteriovorax antillogorgiicola TaxID=1513793 RepID=A0A1Y6CFZ9_9BACT|nr:cyclic nucleotide-binding domain-containing protein [Pseudobacteriovorax antillogorgiicola]TCS47328.1 cyclic nucleotide-binding protein [Pseudobacteriovorax antillogorgiicola]SMF62964.1 Cyclic nucleotide-binding domain-containing protein [Pseudobacteriovorax antillogorgiicola]